MKLNFGPAGRYLSPIHPDGWMFITAFAVGSIVLGMFADPLLYLGLLATAWCAYFFRNPARVVPSREGLIVAPADGVVDSIGKVSTPEELGIGQEDTTRISILLSLMDVHVNRVPIAGEVIGLKYHKGAFINATMDKSHEENERQYIGIKTADGVQVGVVQIAGMISRRIVCNLKENQTVTTGERFGMIRFGSRVDVYLPGDVNPLVTRGQRMVAGETVLADLQSHEAAREGNED